jgi:hypothetical protein
LVNLLRRPGADEDNIDPKENEKKNGRDEKKRLDLQENGPFTSGVSSNIIENKAPLLQL